MLFIPEMLGKFSYDFISLIAVLKMQYHIRCLCDVTLSAYPHRVDMKNMPGHGGNRTYDLWNTSPMLLQLSYAVRTVRVCDISELSLSSFDISVI